MQIMLPYPLIAGNNQLVVHLERKSVVDVNTFEICTSSDAYRVPGIKYSKEPSLVKKLKKLNGSLDSKTRIS